MVDSTKPRMFFRRPSSERELKKIRRKQLAREIVRRAGSIEASAALFGGNEELAQQGMMLIEDPRTRPLFSIKRGERTISIDNPRASMETEPALNVGDKFISSAEPTDPSFAGGFFGDVDAFAKSMNFADNKTRRKR